MRNLVFSATVLATLGLVSACAPSTPPMTTTDIRSPTLGDPGALPGAASATARPNAGQLARSDKQPLGTTNGNQPDRAAAASGAH